MMPQDRDIEWVAKNMLRLRGQYGANWTAVQQQTVVAEADGASDLIAALAGGTSLVRSSPI